MRSFLNTSSIRKTLLLALLTSSALAQGSDLITRLAKNAKLEGDLKPAAPKASMLWSSDTPIATVLIALPSDVENAPVGKWIWMDKTVLVVEASGKASRFEKSGNQLIGKWSWNDKARRTWHIDWSGGVTVTFTMNADLNVITGMNTLGGKVKATRSTFAPDVAAKEAESKIAAEVNKPAPPSAPSTTAQTPVATVITPSPAGIETAPLGEWIWMDKSVLIIEPEGKASRVEKSGNQLIGKWSWNEKETRTWHIDWTNGVTVTFTMTPDLNVMTGMNTLGGKVKAVRATAAAEIAAKEAAANKPSTNKPPTTTTPPKPGTPPGDFFGKPEEDKPPTGAFGKP